MNSFLNGLRVFFGVLFLFVFVNTLFIAIPSISITSNLSDPEKIKSWLSESNVYENIFDNALDIVSADEAKETEQNGPSDNNEVEKTLRETIEEAGLFTVDEVETALKQAIDPDFVRQQVEGLIDDATNFLSGESDTLVFNLSLSERADEFAQEGKDLFNSKLNSLPICSSQDLSRLDDFDPLKAVCRPPGNELNQQIDEFIDEFTKGDGALNESFTAEDLDFSNEELENAQTTYQAMRSFPTAAVVLLLLLIGILLLLSKPWYGALKRIGLSMAIVSLVLLFIFVIGKNGLSDQENLFPGSDMSQQQQDALNNVIKPLGEEIVSDIASTGTMLSLLALLVGIGLFILGIKLSSNHKKEHPHDMLHEDETKDESGKVLDDLEKDTKKDEESDTKTEAEKYKPIKEKQKKD